MNDFDPALSGVDDAMVSGPKTRGWGRSWLALSIVATVVLMAVAAWRQGWFTPTSQLFLELPGASGLQVGTPVRLKGFKIGEVDRITLEQNLNVRVRLRIDTDRMALLGGDARVRFGRDSVIAAKFVELQPGQREGPRLADGKVLPVDASSEIEDIMSTLKQTAEQLTLTLKNVDPILNDTRKLTGDAVALLEGARAPINGTLANVQALSAQLKQLSQATQTLLGHVDKDRDKLVKDVQGVLKQAETAVSTAGKAIAGLEAGLPGTLGKLDGVLDNARAASADLKQVLAESSGDIPPLIRSGRSAAQDAAEVTTKLKNTWPLSVGNTPAERSPLPLDGYEGAPK